MILDELLASVNPPSALKVGRKKIKTAEDFDANRDKIRNMLLKEQYGIIPPAPKHVRVEVNETDKILFAGKTVFTRSTLYAETERGELSFPFASVVPKTEKPCPAFIHINFDPNVPSKRMPSEEIADRGFAVFSFCYTDVATDDNNFKAKCAKILSTGRRRSDATGKIAMWAWAAMRVMDYVMTLPEIDHDNIAVIGHSRLGKTALLTGAFDDRFKYVISNNSGSSGAALARDKVGEDITAITDRFPFWFCPRFMKYRGRESELPFDQNSLLALTVPRHLIVGSAKEDRWADPKNELLSIYSVNEVYKLYGMRGLVVDDGALEAPSTYIDGDASYHIRPGEHCLSRYDWNVYMDFILKCMNK